MSDAAMRAVDSNLLVRLLARDDAQQIQAAEQFVAPGAWVSCLALVESIWVLDSIYQRNPEQLAVATDMLLSHECLVLQDADAVGLALAHFKRRPALGFSDCLMLEIARKAGHLPLGTFDKTLARMGGAQKL